MNIIIATKGIAGKTCLHTQAFPSSNYFSYLSLGRMKWIFRKRKLEVSLPQGFFRSRLNLTLSHFLKGKMEDD
jgi:hypothetical protein